MTLILEGVIDSVRFLHNDSRGIRELLVGLIERTAS